MVSVVFYLKCIYYGIYMLWVRLKGFKWSYLNRFKGSEAAWRYGQKVFSKWTLFTIKVVGMDIKAFGTENIPDETCVFMGNHQSILDIPLLKYTANRDLDFVAKEELLKIPVLGYWLSHLKTVLLDRENAREGVKAINLAINNVKQGYSYVIFPEGTRSKDNEVHEFKKGSIKIASKAKVKIVPFAIKGTASFFSEGKKLVPSKVEIIFGSPIETKDIPKEQEKLLSDELYNSVLKLYDKISF